MSRIVPVPDDEGGLMGDIKILTVSNKREDDDPFNVSWKSLDEAPSFVREFQGIGENFEKLARQKTKYQSPDAMNLYDALGVIEPKYNLDYLSRLYDANSFHAAAVDAKIDNVVGLGYNFIPTRKARLIREEASSKKDTTKRRVEKKLEDGRAQMLQYIDSLNDVDEFDQTLEKFFKDRLTMGNGYLEIGRDKNGVISYIGHIPAKNIRIRQNRDGFVQFNGREPVFFRNFGENTRDPFGRDPRPNEIIHYGRYSPSDEFYGVPEIVAAANAVAGIEFAQRYNIDYFENKAVPRYIIKTKGIHLNDTQQNNLLKYFETTIKGVSHRTILIPIPGGIDKDISFEPVERGQQDSSFDGYIKLNIQIILSRHRVPQGRIGLSTAAQSQGESKEAERSFKESVCKPEQRVIEKKLAKVFSEVTDLFMFKLNEYSLTDEQIQSEINERYLRWGVYVPDEVRESLGMQPRPDGRGDVPLDLGSLAEANMSSEEITQSAAENKAQLTESRTRDQNRNSNTSDSDTSTGSRNIRGEGAKSGK